MEIILPKHYVTFVTLDHKIFFPLKKLPPDKEIQDFLRKKYEPYKNVMNPLNCWAKKVMTPLFWGSKKVMSPLFN